MNDLYSDQLLEQACTLPKPTHLEAPMASATKYSRVCGSTVSVELDVENGLVSQFALTVKACALGQASSAIVAKHIIGERTEVLRSIREAMWAMLRGEKPLPPFEGWEDLSQLEPIRAYKARHVSTMLIFDAVVDCLDQIEPVTKLESGP